MVENEPLDLENAVWRAYFFIRKARYVWIFLYSIKSDRFINTVIIHKLLSIWQSFCM